PGDMPHHASGATGGSDDTRQEFERGGFARTVRTKKGDKLAPFDFQIDSAHRFDRAILALEQSPDRRPQPFALLINAITLCQLLDFNDGHLRVSIACGRSVVSGPLKVDGCQLSDAKAQADDLSSLWNPSTAVSVSCAS